MMAVEIETNVGSKALPDGWKWVRLGDLCIRMSNGTSSPQNPAKVGLPTTRIETISGGVINNERLGWINVDSRDTLANYVLKEGDLLFSHINSVERLGNCAIYLGMPHTLIHGMNLLRLQLCTDQIDPLYCLNYLRSSGAKSFYTTNAKRAIGQASLNTKDLSALPVPLPPLSEQKHIAAILNEQMAAVEKARAACEAQLEAAKELPAAYLRSVFDSSEAQKWERKKLSSLSDTCSGSTPSRDRADYYVGDIPWVKTGELRDNTILDTEEHISEMALRETSVRLLPQGTILVAMYGQGQTRGRTALLGRPCTTNQACFAILPNLALFAPEYLQLWFRHNYGRLRGETEGRGGSQPNLNGEVLRTQEVQLPPIPVQQRVVAYAAQQTNTIERLIASSRLQLETINDLPAAILRKAFNGEL